MNSVVFGRSLSIRNSEVQKLLVILVLLTLNTPLNAQKQEFKHYSGWNTLSVKGELNEEWSLKSEFNFRRTHFLKDWEQIVLRPSVQYSLNGVLSTAIGYSFIHNYPYAEFSAPLSTREDNIWQQLYLKQSFDHFDLNHRLRLEERFRDVVNTVGSPTIKGTEYSNRLRYRMTVSIPMFLVQGLNIVAYDEVFLDLEKGIQPKGLDQNWLFLGIRFPESEHISITSGYHKIYIPLGNNGSVSNHIWETNLTYTFK
ncbi:MAG: DUF2490 domain-containing protein [Pricia sp.]|nr:DUF2490 domain-containing protein [Pricia sp.]